MTSIDEVEGIILSSMEYKENDCIVHIACEDKIISFIAKGALKQNAKNRILIHPFSYVHISLTQTKFPVLTNGHVIESFYRIQENLEAQCICNVLKDCLIRSVPTKEILNHFKKMLSMFHENNPKAITMACVCLKDILKQDGFAMHVTDCVLCHSKKNIETISIDDGGFLCCSCNIQNHPRYHKNELIQYYSLFQFKEEKLSEFIDYYTFDVNQFCFLMKWYCHHEQIQLNSFIFLQSILNL
ncbi:DNA repair protein RecO [Floccifex sp.]|uniref:DNA repair protein RecO n=1 Tax=Floccifex sp. TaxID=2815810 RepID=UPI002A754A10|nr:DNA repair protein RecO [Floccifex sp.]MDD7282044.1 DNA repair protein RecO [Erysipelotrichaceae bacterium]MDY2958100.1 DNA repair protein RecO [Floccifex sp.]